MNNLKQINVETTIPIEALNEITKQLRGSTKDATSDNLSDAAITLSWSVGPAGGSFEGWITYYDGRKIHIIMTGITSKVGTAAGAGAIPWIRVWDWNDMPESGEFDLSGFGCFGAIVHLKSKGKPITSPDFFITTSAAFWDFSLVGTCKYVKS